MLDFPLMLWVKLPVDDRIQPEKNKFVTGVENEATGDSKLNDSPVKNVYSTVQWTSKAEIGPTKDHWQQKVEKEMQMKKDWQMWKDYAAALHAMLSVPSMSEWVT